MNNIVRVAAIAALLALRVPALGAAPPSPADLEEAAAVARHAAEALLRGRPALFDEAFDANALVLAAAGPAAARLTERQRAELISSLLPIVAAMIVAQPERNGSILTLSAEPSGPLSTVGLQLNLSNGHVKTLWRLRALHGEWRIEDVVLSDTSLSAVQQSIRFFGPGPIASIRRGGGSVRRILLPRVAGLAAVVAVFFIFFRRLKRHERFVLVLASGVPALIFVVDGALAVSRQYREPVQLALEPNLVRERLHSRLRSALSRRDLPGARMAAANVLEVGRKAPVALAIALLAESLGRYDEARVWYDRSLESPDLAPGGWAGRARLAMRESDWTNARDEWRRYLAATPPDPDSLALLANTLGRLRQFADARAAAGQALAIAPDDPDLLDLAGRLAAADGDAEAAIGAFRSEEKLRPVPRAALSSDSTLAPIARDPRWIAFLTEPPPSLPKR